MRSTYARSSRTHCIAAMLWASFVMSAVAIGPAGAQQRDTTRRSPRDSVRADSARVADSIAVVRELERLQGEPRAQTQGQQPGQGPTNPRLLPDISAVGDLIADLSPKGSTQEGGERFGVREVELAIQAAVDPYFPRRHLPRLLRSREHRHRAGVLTATSLPWDLEVRLGRFLMPVGKQNTTHRHDLHTVDYPCVVQRFFGDEGLKGTGVYASKVFAPFGFYQELILHSGGSVRRSAGRVAHGTRADQQGAEWPRLFGAPPQLLGSQRSHELRGLSAPAITGRRARPLVDALIVDTVDADPTPAPDDVRRRRHVSLAPAAAGTVQVVHPAGRVHAPVERDGIRRALPASSSVRLSSHCRAADFTGGYVFARYQTRAAGFSAGASIRSKIRSRRPKHSTPSRGIWSSSRASFRSSSRGTSGFNQPGIAATEPHPATGDVRARPAQATSLLIITSPTSPRST